MRALRRPSPAPALGRVVDSADRGRGAAQQPRALGRLDEDPRRVRLLRRRVVPQRRAADPRRRLRARGGRERRGQDAPPPPVPLRARHAVVGAARRHGHGHRLQRRGDRGGAGAGRRARDPGDVHPVRPLRPPRGARRAVRHRLHVVRRPRLAARHRELGPGRGALRPPGRLPLRDRDPSGRPGLRGRGRRARRAPARVSRTGRTPSRSASR